MEVYSLPSEHGSRFLVFQHSPSENKVFNKNSDKDFDMIAKSFEDKQAINELRDPSGK